MCSIVGPSGGSRAAAAVAGGCREVYDDVVALSDGSSLLLDDSASARGVYPP